jgi:hypothetical protein
MESTSDVRLHHDLLVPFGDETIAATRYEPIDADGPQPAVLMVIPYRKDDYITYGSYDPLLRYVASAGYEVVAADLVGTGGSSGVKSHPLDAGEGEEVAAIVEWLADREWTTGRVGMVGKSYGGWTQLFAAERGPDALEAIVPIMPPFSAYDDSRYPGGAMSLKHAGGWLPQMHTFAALPPSYRDDEGRWAEVWRERLEALSEHEPWLFDQLRNETKNDYWQPHQVDVTAFSVPVLAIGGWRDYFPGTTLDHLERVEAPTRLLMGPWRHTIPHRGREVAVEFRDRIVEWFDHFLREEDTAALDRPFLTYWTEREGGGTIDGGVWRTRSDWPRVSDADADGEEPLSDEPLADAPIADETLSFALSADGLVPSDEFESDADSLSAEYEYDATVGAHSIHYLAPPLETTPDDARSLTVETDPLADPIEVTGTGAATIRLRPTTEDLLLSVRVVDVSPDGSASLVTHGVVRASQRDSRSEPDPLTPGEDVAIDLPIAPTSHVFEAGHRIRVAIATAYFPRLLPPREHGSMTVHSTSDAPSEIVLPGRRHPGGVTFDDETTLPPPDESTGPLTSRFVDATPGEFTVARNHRTDELTVRTVDSKTLDLPHGPTMDYTERVEWTARPDDPGGVSVRSWIDATLDYGSDRVHVETTARTDRDTSSLSQVVTRDGVTVFEDTWRL